MGGLRYFPHSHARLDEALRRLLDDPRVVRSEGCWEWTGARTTLGYGRISHHYTHRLVYHQEVQRLEDHLEVAHHCDNPPCVRPEHLFACTHAENIRDARSKGRLDLSHLWRRGEWEMCMKGLHPLSGENLYVYPDGTRECRACKRERWKRWKEARDGREAI